jgi:hypothetical protein
VPPTAPPAPPDGAAAKTTSAAAGTPDAPATATAPRPPGTAPASPPPAATAAAPGTATGTAPATATGTAPAAATGTAPAAATGTAPAAATGTAPAAATAATPGTEVADSPDVDRSAPPEQVNARVIGSAPATAASASGGPASPALAQVGSAGTARRGTSGTGTATTPAPARVTRTAELFARHTRAYVADSYGQQVTILQAGATTACDLGTNALHNSHFDVMVSLIDEDEPATREAVASRPSLSECVLGDLRTVPLSPRAFDIVQCDSLLERIKHAELVLDRLIGAMKPGALLLLRICDRDSAAGFLDRILPETVRRAIWRKRHPGEPGPHPAVYEQLASARGIQAYALLRGLVISERQALGGLAGGLPPGPHGFLAAQKLVAWLSHGRHSAAHEEMLYVLRKPESRFARIL